MNIHNFNYIGATGLYPIDEIIKNTSNELIANDVYNSNQLIIYSSNIGINASNFTIERTKLTYHQNNYPDILWIPTPPLFIPAPYPLAEITEALLTLGTSLGNIQQQFNNQAGLEIKPNHHLIEKILQEHENRFAKNEISAQLFQTYNQEATASAIAEASIAGAEAGASAGASTGASAGAEAGALAGAAAGAISGGLAGATTGSGTGAAAAIGEITRLNILEKDINQSNYVLNTSNLISNRLTDTSNLMSARLTDTSNLMSARLSDTSNLISNRLTDTSNLISNRLTDTSNLISNRITQQFLDLNNEINSAWNSNANGVVYNLDDKICIGTDTIDDVTKLKIIGNTYNDGLLQVTKGIEVQALTETIVPSYGSIQDFLNYYTIIDRFYIIDKYGLLDKKTNSYYNPNGDTINIIFDEELNKYVSRFKNNPQSGFFQPHSIGGNISNTWGVALNIRFNHDYYEFIVCVFWYIATEMAQIRAKINVFTNEITISVWTSGASSPSAISTTKVANASTQHFYIINYQNNTFTIYIDNIEVLYVSNISLPNSGNITKVWIGKAINAPDISFDYSDVLICDGDRFGDASQSGRLLRDDICSYIKSLYQPPDNKLYGKTYIEYLINTRLNMGDLQISVQKQGNNRRLVQVQDVNNTNDTQIINSVNNMINNTNSSGFLRYLDNNIQSSPSLITQIDYTTDITNKPTIPTTTTQIAEGTNLYYTPQRVGIIATASNLDTSNYISTTSNQITNRITTLDSNQSNYVSNTSNQITNRITTLDSNISNYVSNTSNQITNRITTLDSNHSNYVSNTSNQITNRITTLDINQSNYVLNKLNYLSSFDIVDNYLLTLSGSKIFNLSKTLDSSLIPLLTKTNPNDSNRYLTLNILDDDIFYIFSYATANNSITYNFGNTIYNGIVVNPNNQITSIASSNFSKSYQYANTVVGNSTYNKININLTSINPILSFKNAFTFSINLKYTQYNFQPLNILQILDNDTPFTSTRLYLQLRLDTYILPNSEEALIFKLWDSSGNIKLTEIIPIITTSYNPIWVNWTLIFNNNDRYQLQFYENGTLKYSNGFLSVIPPIQLGSWNYIIPNNMTIRLLEDCSGKQIEYLRVIPRVITSYELQKVYDIYSDNIISLQELDVSQSNYVKSTSNNLINYTNGKDLNISNYVKSTSNYLQQQINTNYNDYLNSLYWVPLGAGGTTIYSSKHIRIGNFYQDADTSKLYVAGDIKAISGFGSTNGNDSNSFSESQISLSYFQTDYYKHTIRTRHRGVADNQNAIDFYLWNNLQSYNSTGNKHMMSITAGGVGIGKTNPIETLDIIGNVNITGDYKINGSSLGNNISNYVLSTSNVISNRISSQWTSTTDNKIYYNNSNVGINVYNPSFPTFSSNMTANLQINPVVRDDNVGWGGMKNYSGYPLVLTNTTPSSDVIINDPQPVLALARQGTGGKAYGSMVVFKMCRYENAGTNSRTRLDLNMYHNVFGEMTTPVITFLSSNTGGYVGIGTTNPKAKLELYDSTQISSRLILSGQEFYQPSNTSTDGISLLLGINRTGNKQLWIGDSANLTQNATNKVIRIWPNYGVIDCLGTDGATGMDLSLGFLSSITCKANGSVGIGTTNTSGYKLNVNGSCYGASLNAGNTYLATNLLSFTNNGNAYQSGQIQLGSGGWQTASYSTIYQDGTNSGSSYWNRIVYNTYNPTTTSGHYFTGGGYSTSVGINMAPQANNWQLLVSGNTYCSSGVWNGCDMRIKKNIQDIDDDEALQKILMIEPKKYEYIDSKRKVSEGADVVFGFIAQQVMEVIPEAVRIKKEIIPNILSKAIYDSNIIYFSSNIDCILTSNQTIQITANEIKEDYKITDYGSNYIVVDTDIKLSEFVDNSGNCFVYGTEVDDFHSLDKNYIYTLNVCATQELYRIIERQGKEIERLTRLYENLLLDFNDKTSNL